MSDAIDSVFPEPLAHYIGVGVNTMMRHNQKHTDYSVQLQI